jgi:transposase
VLRIPQSIRVFAYTRAVPFSLGVDSLLRKARALADADPFAGNIYCFFSRQRNQVKLLVWDRNGFWVFAKRLERGRFERLETGMPWREISREELVMLLEGIDTKTARFRRNFPREIRIQSRGRHDGI